MQEHNLFSNDGDEHGTLDFHFMSETKAEPGHRQVPVGTLALK